MSTWDDYRLTCFHVIQEGLDSYECYRIWKYKKERIET